MIFLKLVMLLKLDWQQKLIVPNLSQAFWVQESESKDILQRQCSQVILGALGDLELISKGLGYL